MLASVNRLAQNKDVKAVKQYGQLYQLGLFGVMVLKKDEDETSRFTFVVSKKISKLAVQRNRIKRALAEAVRQHLDVVGKGYDMIFLAKAVSEKKSTDEIMREVKTFILGKKFIRQDMKI